MKTANQEEKDYVLGTSIFAAGLITLGVIGICCILGLPFKFIITAAILITLVSWIVFYKIFKWLIS